MSFANYARPPDRALPEGEEGQPRIHCARLSPAAIIDLTLDGTVSNWDKNAEHLFGVAPVQAIGASISAVLPHLALDHLPYLLEKASRGECGGPVESTRRESARMTTISISTAPVLDSAGAVASIALFASEMTAQAREREHQALIVQDLNHRMKNAMATVHAIAVQVFDTRSSSPTVRTEFLTRLAALTRSHTLLQEADWRGSLLYDVLAAQVAPYCAGAPDRCSLHGPVVHLKPEAALTLGMAIHELSANAAKYGAFSVTDGAVDVYWRFTEIKGQHCLELSWRERGGPPVAAPRRRGLGSRLIEHGLACEFGGQAHLEFDPGGVQYSLTAPLAALEARQ